MTLPTEAARTLGGSPDSDHRLLEDTALLIDARAAAEALSMSTRQLWGLTKRNAIPVRRIGRSVRYSPTELIEWIAAGCPTEPGAADQIRKAVGR